MTCQSTAMMLAQMLQGKKTIAIAAHSSVDKAASVPCDLSQSNSQATHAVAQIQSNQNMEQLLNTILGASFDNKNTPME